MGRERYGAPVRHLQWITWLILLAGCGPGAPRQSNLHLAMVDYWPAGRLLFVAAPGSGVVDVLRVPAEPRQAGLEFIERLDDPARRQVIRLVVDRRRGSIWIADSYAVHIHHYRSGTSLPTRVVRLPSDDPRFAISDLSIDEEGNGYAHTRGGARIYRIDAITYALENWLEPFSGVVGPASALSRVLHTRDQRHVLVRSPVYDLVLQIDLRSKNVAHLRPKHPVNLDCALLFWRGDSGAVTALNCYGLGATDIELQ